MSDLKVLFVSPEVVPFMKTGGLADVAGSLPKALNKLGVDVRVIMPKYKHIPEKYLKNMKSIANGNVDMLYRSIGFEVFSLTENNITYYFIEHHMYFDRDGLYGYGDDGERFTFFCKAVFEMLPLINFKPDIIHSNDWQSGVMSLLQKTYFGYREFYKGIKTVFTIHNMKYQGAFPKEIMDSLLGISWDHFTYNSIEYYEKVNYLKAGIIFSDLVNTVSKTYAEEIKHDFFAENLGGTVREKGSDIWGILNGIDYEENNPQTDERLYATYSAKDLSGKIINKTKLQESLGLPVNPNTPIIGIVTRLVDQKGLDLIGSVLHEILEQDVQIVLLGTGEYRYEEMFKYYQHAYPEKVSCNIKYDSVLSQRIYAASDMFLMPSLFEPCGLSQLISLRYGTIPIVRETGGLKDTITPYNIYTKKGNGFSFSNYNAHDMLHTIRDAVNLYHSNKKEWKSMVVRGMKQDYSWEQSAKEYLNYYEAALKK